MRDRWPRLLVPLRHRDFRLLWTGQTVSSFGNHVQGIAMPFQLLALGASPLQLGIAVALDTLSSVAFLLVGGAVADRVARRTLILASDLVGGCVVATLAFLSATEQLRIEHVYLARIALGAADAFLRPAYTRSSRTSFRAMCYAPGMRHGFLVEAWRGSLDRRWAALPSHLAVRHSPSVSTR